MLFASSKLYRVPATASLVTSSCQPSASAVIGNASLRPSRTSRTRCCVGAQSRNRVPPSGRSSAPNGIAWVATARSATAGIPIVLVVRGRVVGRPHREAEGFGAIDNREHSRKGDVGPCRPMGEFVTDLVERLLDQEQTQEVSRLPKICGKTGTLPDRLSISVQEGCRHPSGAGRQP